MDYHLTLRSASVVITRQQGSKSDVPGQQYEYIFDTGTCQSGQSESKTEGEKGHQQKRSISVDSGRQQNSSLVDSSQQQVSSTEGDEKQDLTSEVSHYLQVSNSEKSSRWQGSVEENTCRRQELGEEVVVDRMRQASLDINQQKGWTESETTQYQRAPPAVSSRRQGLIREKHGRQEAL